MEHSPFALDLGIQKFKSKEAYMDMVKLFLKYSLSGTIDHLLKGWREKKLFSILYHVQDLYY